jgi:hypothetical protein
VNFILNKDIYDNWNKEESRSKLSDVKFLAEADQQQDAASCCRFFGCADFTRECDVVLFPRQITVHSQTYSLSRKIPGKLLVSYGP